MIRDGVQKVLQRANQSDNPYLDAAIPDIRFGIEPVTYALDTVGRNLSQLSDSDLAYAYALDESIIAKAKSKLKYTGDVAKWAALAGAAAYYLGLITAEFTDRGFTQPKAKRIVKMDESTRGSASDRRIAQQAAVSDLQ
jgi:hypothetical protein